MARSGVGLAEAFITPAAFSLIRDRVPLATRGRAFSILAFAPSFGGAMALIAGGKLIAAADAGSFELLPVLGTLKHWEMVMVIVGLSRLPLY